MMITIDPRDIPVPKMHAYFLGAVVPRPIAFASTIDREGNINLSPFSFFNVFSTRPPVMIFSPARRVRDNTTKHTLQNVEEVPEVVINIVNYAMVQQASLASTEYEKGVNEFVKAGLTPVSSQKIKPPRVAEAPVSFECKVNQVISLGSEGGAGNLVLCEVLLMHIKEDVLDAGGRIDPQKLDAVARMGGDDYCRASGRAVFQVPKPVGRSGLGVDQLPAAVRASKVLTGNDLGLLGNMEQLPDKASAATMMEAEDVKRAFSKGEEGIHQLAKQYIESGKVEDAWKILIAYYD